MHTFTIHYSNKWKIDTYIHNKISWNIINLKWIFPFKEFHSKEISKNVAQNIVQK